MAIAEPEPLIHPTERLFIAADLAALPTELPSGPIDYELDDGRLVFIMVPPGDIHGALQSNIVTELKIQGERKGHGKARTEVGILLWRSPDRVVGADVVFVAAKSLPIRRTREGYLDTVPELVVEIRSKNDSLAYLRRKVKHYLKAGVQIVWLVDAATTTVSAHTQSAEPAVYGHSDALELPSLIPGFSMPVAEVFRE